MTIRISENLRVTRSPDGGVILDVKVGRMFRVNLVGSKIIELLEQRHSPDGIARDIASTFTISEEVARRDVREFIEILQTFNLIEAPVSDLAN